MFAPEQDDLYDGHFVVSANRIYMIGGLNDEPGWNHLDNAGATAKAVSGTAEIDVDDLKNTGKFEARLEIPEGDLVQIDFYIRSPQQNPNNKPNREVFMHFFGMEITWK